MNLLEQIESDYVVAYKAKDAIRLSVLRLLKTALKNLQVERARAPLTAADALDVVVRQVKQRKDSIAQYRAAHREDLAAREEAEMIVLESYLPERICGDALKTLVAAVIAETGAAGPKDMGKVMQALNAGHKGGFDGREAGEAVKAALAALG
jgi:uncharacterized protein YqeY